MMLLAILLMLFHGASSHQNVSKIPVDIILEKMKNSSYDMRVRPTTKNNGPVVVAVDLFVRSISNIDFVSMQYDLQVTFREMWEDPRLAYEEHYVNGDIPKFIIMTDKDAVWRPDAFFRNEKRAHRHEIDKPNILIRIFKNGTVLFSERITLTLSCPMHLHRYPMDVQNCSLEMASYAYTTKDIKFVWNKNPIQQHEGLNQSLPSFTLTKVDYQDFPSSTSTGIYSGLRATFLLSRQFSYYVVQVYIPSTLLVIVSWVSFWLDRTAVPARVTLGVTTLLTMTTQAASINSKLPPVSYIKAIDIWIGVCLIFIFSAVLEFAWVSYVSKERELLARYAKCAANGGHGNEKPPDAVTRAMVENEKLLLAGDANGNAPFEGHKARSWCSNFFVCKMFKYADEAQLIDVKSRIIFPIVFIVFNLMYWIGYWLL